MEKVMFNISQYLSFSEALTILENGGRVVRKGWNGKNMYIEKSVNLRFGQFRDVSVEDCLLIVNFNDGRINTWVPSSSDLVAKDWCEAQVALEEK